jgi:hypothetical protein
MGLRLYLGNVGTAAFMGAPRRARPADQLSHRLPDAISATNSHKKQLALAHAASIWRRERAKKILKKNYNSLDTHCDFKLSRASYFNRLAI